MHGKVTRGSQEAHHILVTKAGCTSGMCVLPFGNEVHHFQQLAQGCCILVIRQGDFDTAQRGREPEHVAVGYTCGAWDCERAPSRVEPNMQESVPEPILQIAQLRMGRAVSIQGKQGTHPETSVPFVPTWSFSLDSATAGAIRVLLPSMLQALPCLDTNLHKDTPRHRGTELTDL